MIDFPSTAHAQCPYPVYERISSESRVYQVPGRREFLLTHYEDIVYAAQHPELFSNFGAYTPPPAEPTHAHVVESDPPSHRDKRELIYASLTPGRLRAHGGAIERFVDQLIDEFVEAGQANFVTAFASPLPVLVISHLLNLPVDRKRIEWFEVVSATTATENRYRDKAVVAATTDYRDEIDAMARMALLQRKDDPGDGVLGEILRAKVARDGAWDLDDMLPDVSVLISGGIKTTAHLLASGLLLLLLHREQLLAVSADPSLIPRTVDEILRIESPFQWVPRVCTADTEVAGHLIPAGSRVLLLLGAANRDPDQFPEPDEFRPQRREARRHLAFGHGIHFCLGAPLARLETAIAFQRLLTRLRNLRLVDGTDIRYLESTQMRAPADLQIAFEPARRSSYPPLFAST